MSKPIDNAEDHCWHLGWDRDFGDLDTKARFSDPYWCMLSIWTSRSDEPCTYKDYKKCGIRKMYENDNHYSHGDDGN